jgi:KDO2-lipid IV(A) lauroyltransferase
MKFKESVMIDNVISSRFGPSVGLFLVRIVPRKLALWIGSLVTSRMAKKSDSEIIKAIRANQAVVRGLPYDDSALDDAVVEVMKYTAQAYVDSYKAIAGGREVVLRYMKISDEILENVDTWLNDGRGLVVVGPHLAGFDLVALLMGVKGYPILGLSYPDPTGSYATQHTLRKKFGFEAVPVSVQVLKRAFRHLRGGGVVITAVDRPGLGGEPMDFFGRKVILPTGHARIAVKTKSPMLVGVPVLGEDGVYKAEMAALIEPPNTGNQLNDALAMAQEALASMEPFIRKRPEKWMMFHPLWPDVIPTNTS